MRCEDHTFSRSYTPNLSLSLSQWEDPCVVFPNEEPAELPEGVVQPEICGRLSGRGHQDLRQTALRPDRQPRQHKISFSCPGQRSHSYIHGYTADRFLYPWKEPAGFLSFSRVSQWNIYFIDIFYRPSTDGPWTVLYIATLSY